MGQRAEGREAELCLQRDKTHYRCDRKDNTRFSVQTRLLMDAQTQVSAGARWAPLWAEKVRAGEAVGGGEGGGGGEWGPGTPKFP